MYLCQYPRARDAGRCVTLYNEIKGEFPKWIPPDAHNSLMGCMRCQLKCPANSEVIELTGRLEDITEEETTKILNGTPDEELLASLSRKLRNYYPTQSKEYLPIFTRNLRALYIKRISALDHGRRNEWATFSYLDVGLVVTTWEGSFANRNMTRKAMIPTNPDAIPKRL